MSDRLRLFAIVICIGMLAGAVWLWLSPYVDEDDEDSPVVTCYDGGLCHANGPHHVVPCPQELLEKTR